MKSEIRKLTTDHGPLTTISRRDLLTKAARAAAGTALAAIAACLVWRGSVGGGSDSLGEQTCTGAGICTRCGAMASCGLPAALSAKEVIRGQCSGVSKGSSSKVSRGNEAGITRE